MRVDDWPSRMFEVVEARRIAPFEWGQNDCVIFAAACIAAITGSNPIADLKPWKTERTAMKRIAEVGGFEAWLDARYQRVEWYDAMRGDVGLLVQSDGPIIVVNVGNGWCGPSEDGLTTSPHGSVYMAWRVE